GPGARRPAGLHCPCPTQRERPAGPAPPRGGGRAAACAGQARVVAGPVRRGRALVRLSAPARPAPPPPPPPGPSPWPAGGDGKDGGPLSVKRFLSGGTRLSPPDERVFNELARHESRFDGKFILGDDDIADLLPLLRSRRVVYRGTALRFSPEPARPQVHLSSTPGGARARIEFQLSDGRTTSFDTSLLLIGRRTTMLLEGQTAYALEPDLPARLWRAWMREPSMTFPTAQVERALSFFA